MEVRHDEPHLWRRPSACRRIAGRIRTDPKGLAPVLGEPELDRRAGATEIDHHVSELRAFAAPRWRQIDGFTHRPNATRNDGAIQRECRFRSEEAVAERSFAIAFHAVQTLGPTLGCLDVRCSINSRLLQSTT